MADEYSKPFTVILQGQPLAEVSQITTKTDSGDKPVMTLAQGLAGFSDGPAQCELTGKSALPLAGFEADFAELCMLHVTRQFQIRLANKILTVKGRFMSVTESSSVENPNEVDFTFHGRIVSRRVI